MADESKNANHQDSGTPVSGEIHELETEDEIVIDETVEVIELDGSEWPGDGKEDEKEDEEGEEEEEEGEGEEEEEPNYSVILQSHTSPVHCIAINPKNPSIAITGGEDDMAYVWDITTGEKQFELMGHTDTVISVGFSQDGSMIASAGYDSTVRIWNATGELMHVLEGPGDSLEWIKWHPRGNVLLGGSADGTAWMWLAATGACMAVLAGHESSVTCGSFSHDGKRVVTGSEDTTVRVWSPRAGVCDHVFRGHNWHEAPITCIAVHPSEPVILTGSADGTSKLANIESGRILATFVHSSPQDLPPEFKNQEETEDDDEEEEEESEEYLSVESVGFSFTHQWCATGGLDGMLIIWDSKSHMKRASFQHPNGVIRLSWHPSRAMIYSGCLDGVIRLWDCLALTCVHQFRGHTAQLLDMVITTSLMSSHSSCEEKEGTTDENIEGDVILSTSDDCNALVFIYEHISSAR